MYTNYKEQFSLLSEIDRGILIMGLFEYVENGVLPELNGMPLMAFSFIKSQLDRDSEKYKTRAERSRANGKKGGRPRKNNDETTTDEKPKETQKTQRVKSKPRKPDNDNDNVNDNVNVNVRDKGIKDSCANSPLANSARESIFEKFWKAYPKKKGKGNCKRWFNSHKPSNELVGKMITAIEAQKKSDEWLKDNGQFIPLPYTWLNGERWEDEIYTPPTTPTVSRFKTVSL